MKEIVVISGKGGTGKTSLTAAFAALARDAVLADCDVDAADLHLLLEPDIRQTQAFSGGKLARIDPARCTRCGECHEVCRFEAICLNEGAYAVEPMACEGCGICVHFCPAGAIEFRDAINGQWSISDTRLGPMVHARLKPGEENSGKLVTLLRREARQIAEDQGREMIIVDGSPGVGCPVIASVTGADLVLIVTEPTLSGRHDLDRVAKLVAHFDIPAAVCVNKWDINPEIAHAVEGEASAAGLTWAGKISYNPAVTAAQLQRRTIIEHGDDVLRQEVTSIWNTVSELLKAQVGDT
ncbi:MAG: ATP-binding protein [Sedimentisphaerales bacterium]|nr:ATP-binding protein [Sedimentisphaerales bacterium]